MHLFLLFPLPLLSPLLLLCHCIIINSVAGNMGYSKRDTMTPDLQGAQKFESFLDPALNQENPSWATAGKEVIGYKVIAHNFFLFNPLNDHCGTLNSSKD